MIAEPKMINEALQALGAVWIQIQEYRSTHGYIDILLTEDGARQKVGRVWLTDCFFICGCTSGGPFNLTVVEEQTEGNRIVVLMAGKDFVTKGIRIGYASVDEKL